MSRTNRGLVKLAQDKAAVQDIPFPRLRDDYIRIRTIAVALNPADWQDLGEPYELGRPPLLIGCDFAGIVEAVGPQVTKKFSVGDRVFGGGHGTNDVQPEDGTFGQYIVTRGDTVMHKPSNLSFTDAATLPSGLVTVALGLYKHLSLPLPPAKVEGQPWLLVYGGSSATDHAYTIHRGVLETNAQQRDPECGSKIQALTGGSLTRVFDTIATPDTALICAAALAEDEPGLYVNLMGIESPRKDVKSVFFLGYTAMGEEFWFDGEKWPVDHEDFSLWTRFATIAEGLLEAKKIVPHPALVRDGGLDGIYGGMMDMKAKKISGQKLVYILGKNEAFSTASVSVLHTWAFRINVIPLLMITWTCTARLLAYFKSHTSRPQD
ncbi:hypothetical protein MRB53_041920 [Persea americana]|nr:hypothetical protein MRB53_041920 [Persea americana]